MCPAKLDLMSFGEEFRSYKKWPKFRRAWDTKLGQKFRKICPAKPDLVVFAEEFRAHKKWPKRRPCGLQEVDSMVTNAVANPARALGISTPTDSSPSERAGERVSS